MTASSGWPTAGDPPWLHRLEVCESTNTWARQRIEVLLPGTLVHAARQTAGRGQHGRRWHAPPGTLTVSLILHLPLGPDLSPLGLAVGLGVCEAIAAVAPGQQPVLKWPNDVYLADRKLAGILCEGSVIGDRLRIVAGIGLNLRADFAAAGLTAEDFPDLRLPPISLHERCAELPDEVAVMSALRDAVTTTVTSLVDAGPAALAARWRARDWLLGRAVRVQAPGASPLQGTAAGIDERGCLLLRTTDDTTVACMAGHVALL